MKFNVLAGALLVVLASGAFAQHDHGQAQSKPQMDPAMMEAMMKAGMPGDAHKLLDGMTGSWDAKVTFWMVPGADPVSSSGTAENKWIMGGRYLEERFKGEMMGAPFEGVGYTGYDNVKKTYWGTWMDSMSTGLMTSTGNTSDGGKTWAFKATMADPMSGQDSTVDEKIIVTDKDHHTMEMWGPGPDGRTFKMMEIHYSRRK